MQNRTDQELLDAARQLDRDALTEVYERFNLELYRYAYRLLGSEDQAEECVAETFMRFLRALNRKKGPRRHLRAYLYRIAHNWVMDFYRRGPPPMIQIDSNITEKVSDDGPALSHQVETRLQLGRVRELLMELTQDQRQVIVLKYLEGWDNREIASAIQKSVGAVKSLQARALASLARKVQLGQGEEA